MAPLEPPRFFLPLALFILFISAIRVASATPSIPLAYCASVNTNSGFKPFTYQWQSEGRCKDNCTTSGFALAVLQNFDCWCSNTVPARSDQESTDNCNKPCPGYPTDFCGGDDTFAYLALGKAPSSTADGDKSAPQTTSVSVSEQTSMSVSKQTTTHAVVIETETVQSTVVNTVTVRPPVSLTPDPSSSSSSSTSTHDISPSNTEPVVQTVTVGGTVKTVTAIPTSTGGSPPALAEANTSNGLATGAAVGIAVGVIAGLAVVGVFLWMWCIRKRRRNEAIGGGQYESPSVHGSLGGMMGTPKSPEVSDNRFGSASSGGDGASTWDANGKRRSHLMPIDPRLDPFAKGIYVGAQNKSHESISSLQDNHDYSRRVHHPPRVLRAVNPDPDDD